MKLSEFSFFVFFSWRSYHFPQHSTAFAPLDVVVVGVILLGVHGGDEVDGLVDCVAFTRFANSTPSYCTPFNSIDTTNCCSPDSEPAKAETKVLINKFVTNTEYGESFVTYLGLTI